MALQDIKGGAWLPPIAGIALPPAMAPVLMDASTEKVAYIFHVPKTGTLDKVEFTVGTVSVNASSQIRVSFQDVSATTGDPDGTQDQYRDIAGSAFSSNAWMVPGLMTIDGTDGGAKRSVTRGQLLSVTIEYATFTAADSINVNGLTSAGVTSGAPIMQAYADLYTGVWTKQTSHPSMALKYNDGTYEFVAPFAYPISAVGTVSIGTTTNPDEVGLIFQVPSTVKVGGAWLIIDLDGPADIILYDSDGSTALSTTALDPDQRQAANQRTTYVPFESDVTLTANTNYRLVVKPTTTTALTVYYYDVSAAAHLDATEGGQNFHYTSRVDAGSWSQTTTRRPWVGLRLVSL